jgi:hypothetical protein
MTLLYHLDENMPHAIANELQQQGVDVTTTFDAGLVQQVTL